MSTDKSKKKPAKKAAKKRPPLNMQPSEPRTDTVAAPDDASSGVVGQDQVSIPLVTLGGNGPPGYPVHSELMTADGGYVMCGGLLMTPPEAGLRAPERGMLRPVACALCSPKVGLIEASESVYRRVQEAGRAAGIVDTPREDVTMGHLGHNGRFVLRLALDGLLQDARAKRAGFARLLGLGLVRPSGSATQAGWELAARAGWKL